MVDRYRYIKTDIQDNFYQFTKQQKRKQRKKVREKESKCIACAVTDQSH